MTNQTQIPSARVPLIEGENNLISREWFRYLNNLNTLAGGGTGVISVAGGGTGLSTIPANGQLLIGNGVGYSLNTLSAGSNIAIANGVGNISVSFSGILAPGQGGTGNSATPDLGSILIGNGTNYSLGTVSAGPGIDIDNDGAAITVSLAGGGFSGPPGQDGQDAEGNDFYTFAAPLITTVVAATSGPPGQDGQDAEGNDFYAFAAPPITTPAAPSATYSTGSAVAVFHPDDTYGGYTVGQIVTALKAANLLS